MHAHAHVHGGALGGGLLLRRTSIKAEVVEVGELLHMHRQYEPTAAREREALQRVKGAKRGGQGGERVAEVEH